MIKIPRIANVAIDRLVEPETNPNVMEEAHFDLLNRAIADPRVGFLQPLLVREPLPGEMPPEQESVARLGGGVGFYRIVDGVHRYRAAKAQGATELPCVVLEGDVDNATIAALQIGMNRLRGELNLADVARTVSELATSNGWSVADLTITGMTETEVSDLLKAVRPTVDDVLANAALGGAGNEPDPGAGAFPLEIVFRCEADRKRAARALKKAAGKGNGLDVGMLRLLDE